MQIIKQHLHKGEIGALKSHELAVESFIKNKMAKLNQLVPFSASQCDISAKFMANLTNQLGNVLQLAVCLSR